MQQISSNNFIILGSKHLHLWKWNFGIVLFSEKNMCAWPSRIRFSIVILCLWVLERCPDELYEHCHRHTPNPVFWTHSLVITPHQKGVIFFYSKRWVVPMGLKHHKNMYKQRFQHLKALFIHFTQLCDPWITHKKWYSNTFTSSFKITQN